MIFEMMDSERNDCAKTNHSSQLLQRDLRCLVDVLISTHIYRRRQSHAASHRSKLSQDRIVVCRLNWQAWHSIGQQLANQRRLTISTLKRYIELVQWVEYSASKGREETPTTPREDAAIEIESVMCLGMNVLPSLSRSEIDNLEDECRQEESDKREDHTGQFSTLEKTT